MGCHKNKCKNKCKCDISIQTLCPPNPPVDPCVRNAQTTLAATSALNNIILANSTTNTAATVSPFTQFFAPNGTFTFNAAALPFGGTYTVAQLPGFFNSVASSGLTVTAISAPRDFTISPDCLTTTITQDLTSVVRCPRNPALSQTFTLPNVAVYKFNSFGQIVSVNIFADLTGIVAYTATCGLLTA